MKNVSADELANRILSGDERVASRVISLIENGDEKGFQVVSYLYPKTGKAFRIGVTGSTGAGKSTIVDKIALAYGQMGKKIGVIAIDPTSIKSKGAFFGDRLRFKNAEKIEGIFIRSMAHRGFSGGISKAALGAELVLEALGKEIIIVESVGVGQTELGISYVSDVVITVLTPDFGDEIQLMKAGLLDIGDIVVMNKMDLPGAEEKAKDLLAYLESIKKDSQMSVIKVIGKTGEGIERLIKILEKKRETLKEDGIEKTKALVLAFAKEELTKSVEKLIEKDPECVRLIEDVQKRRKDPYSISRMIVSILVGDGRSRK
ncbi:MAG: methylmalonyl Co-A mutase-associated GTPase MeaB [Desulfobacterota bacterium]|nr:methylmalonyl Co-A mutase-associated GTPase MeaB [Thermodesulfobacteriota bacterium]MDW8001486.1 GTP-binding protein [Deltaproteobacteria bacterium]